MSLEPRRRLTNRLIPLVGAGLAAAAWVGFGMDRAPTPPRDGEPGRLRPPAQRLQWGAYHIDWGARRYREGIETEAAQFASKPAYLMFYRDLPRGYPRDFVEAIAARDATPIVSLELWEWGRGGRRGKFLSRINAGEYDAHFENWATAAKEHGQRVLLRFGFECNGEWFSWSGDPEGYVAAWRRIHSIFKRIGAANVEWVFSPNRNSVPDTPENAIHLYYPGDEYVDWVAADGYNWGFAPKGWNKWESCQDVFEDVLKLFAERYPSKPVMIAEFGSNEGEPGQKAQWIKDAYAWLSPQRQIHAAIWFNYDKRREGECDWRIASSPESLRAFNESFAAP